MEFVLPAIALLLLLLAGGGILLLLLAQERKIDALEFFSLAFLCGCLFISLSSFLLGWLLSGLALRVAISFFCLAIFGLGVMQAKRRSITIIGLLPQVPKDFLLFAILLLSFGWLTWFSARTGLGWDGVFHWEIKARLAFENGGALPLSYLTEKTLWFSHRGYPLLLPLSEAWFYGWIGQAHQGLIKLFFPLFFLAALGLLATAEGSRKIAAPLILCFVPLVLFGDGSVSAGYADFPVAVYYLGAVIYLLKYWQDNSAESLRIFAVLSLALPWTKQEGNVLFVMLAALLLLKILTQKNSWQARLRLALIALAPGLFLMLGWSIFVKIFKTPVEQYYLSPTFATLKANLHRTPIILRWLSKEIVAWNHWGILWLAFPLSALLLLFGKQRQRTIILTLTVLLPIAAYTGIYYFVATERISIEEWLLTSFARLMLHVAPVAVLIIGSSLNTKKISEAVSDELPIVQ